MSSLVKSLEAKSTTKLLARLHRNQCAQDSNAGDSSTVDHPHPPQHIPFLPAIPVLFVLLICYPIYTSYRHHFPLVIDITIIINTAAIFHIDPDLRFYSRSKHLEGRAHIEFQEICTPTKRRIRYLDILISI